MKTFDYSARDQKSAKNITGEIQAENEASASKLLSQRGLVPLEITAKKESHLWNPFGNRIPTKEKIIFTRQLATLVGAGLPLVQGLTSVRDQMTNKPLKEIVSQVITEVESGSALSAALGHHPKTFDEIYISLIAAGEASGTLDKSLERLATQQEKDAAILSKVRGALVYPVIVLLVLVAVVIFMLTTVLPSVQGLYKDLPGVELPFVTQLLLSLSNAVSHFWWVFLLLGGIGGYVFVHYLHTENGRSVADSFKLRSPGIGKLFQKLYMARFARIGGTLVAAGVPILQMLSTTANAVGNVHVKATITKASEQVKGGKALSDSLQGDPNFTDLVPSMIRIGEQSGSLDAMLSRLADYYENEVETQVKSISTIIEPVLMIAVGILALIIVAAVLLPIYSLAGKVSGV